MKGKICNFTLRCLTTASFCVLIVLFWDRLLPGHLHYQESMQYFPMTLEYFFSSFLRPSGVASWTSEFLTQFFGNSFVGGFIIAVLLVLLQTMCWDVMRKFSRSGDITPGFYPLSFIPAVCALAFLCEGGNMLSAIIALLKVLGCFWLLSFSCRSTNTLSLLNDIFWTILLYWCFGPFALIYALLAVAGYMMAAFSEHRSFVSALLPSLFLLALAALLPLLVSLFYPLIPLERFYTGLDYCHIPGQYNLSYKVLPVSLLLCCLAGLAAPVRKFSIWADTLVFALSLALLGVFGYAYVKPRISFPVERAYSFNHALWMQDWDEVLRLSKYGVSSATELCCVNVALVMDGSSGDRLFHYQQHGPDCLFPVYERGYMSMLPGSEALFHAGLLNMSMHYAFEANQAAPDFRQGVRPLKRLAEVNMINGNREVACRYLRALEKTLFYRKWARAHLDDAFLAAMEYAHQFACRDSSDRIWHDSDTYQKMKMLESIVERNALADKSWEFLLAFDLLAKDLDSFYRHFSLVDPPYSCAEEVPVHYQEAFVMKWLRSNDASVLSGGFVSAEMADKARAFRECLLSNQSPSAIKQKYGRTYWYYFANMNN